MRNGKVSTKENAAREYAKKNSRRFTAWPAFKTEFDFAVNENYS